MSALVSVATGRTASLVPRSLVGRSPSARVRCDSPRVSQEHAIVRWSSAGWLVRDLGSRNGTWLDADRLVVGGG